MARPRAGKFVMRTPEEKERIVLEGNERGVRRTAEAHGVDRRLLQRWIAKYRAAGVDGLNSQTGKHRGRQPPRRAAEQKEQDRGGGARAGGPQAEDRGRALHRLQPEEMRRRFIIDKGLRRLLQQRKAHVLPGIQNPTSV